MADDNLTNALFTLKDKEPTQPLKNQKPKQQNRHGSKKNSLPFRKRSFDSMYGFSVTLLVIAVCAQIVAIIAFS